MYDTQLLRKAITGSISKKELHKLYELLDAQPELREELWIEQVMYEFRNSELKKDLKVTIQKQNKSSKNSKLIWGTLFLLIILFVIGYCWSQFITKEKSPINFAAIHLAEISVSPALLMSDEVKNLDSWTLAITSYSAGDFGKALRLINTIRNPSDEQRLYAGLCYINLDPADYAAANVIMKSLQRTDKNLLYDQALWYGALTDIQLKRNKEAKRQLLNIVNDNLWKHDEATELLRLLALQ